MIFAPTSIEELADILGEATARRQTLAVTGTGSKPGLGPGGADARLDLAGLGHSIRHDPDELLLTASAATPLAEIQAVLARAGQCLAFEPPSPDAIWSGGDGTLGGTVACALSGPRRPFAGAARDHVLGLTGVTGRGEIFRAGGKVLKNVTGFDLPRLLTGARGSLAVMTEITVKVLPLAPAQATLRIAVDRPAAAVSLLAAALKVDGGITGAAWVDGAALLRVESTAAALPALIDAARARIPGGEVIEDTGSRAIWASVGSLAGAIGAEEIVWRCPLPAARAPALVAALPDQAVVRLDWAGALAWVILPPALADCDVHAAMAAAAGRDGHAERLRGPASAVPARLAPEPALAALSARIKASFDPAGILSPGTTPGVTA
ncbi:FAD-binding protein [Novosphingobium sp.]|uniref:FAD-binding protein n=1 Tax=Novosphingobium sp. TaxID=1874826 RepID=UPI00262B6F6A|nr:FAD-binding protein [Novosphingobium sp.]